MRSPPLVSPQSGASGRFGKVCCEPFVGGPLRERMSEGSGIPQPIAPGHPCGTPGAGRVDGRGARHDDEERNDVPEQEDCSIDGMGPSGRRLNGLAIARACRKSLVLRVPRGQSRG